MKIEIKISSEELLDPALYELIYKFMDEVSEKYPNVIFTSDEFNLLKKAALL